MIDHPKQHPTLPELDLSKLSREELHALRAIVIKAGSPKVSAITTQTSPEVATSTPPHHDHRKKPGSGIARRD